MRKNTHRHTHTWAQTCEHIVVVLIGELSSLNAFNASATLKQPVSFYFGFAVRISKRFVSFQKIGFLSPQIIRSRMLIIWLRIGIFCTQFRWEVHWHGWCGGTWWCKVWPKSFSPYRTCQLLNSEHIVLITQNRIWIVLTLGEQSEQSEWLYRNRKCVLWSSLLLLVRTEEIRKTLIFVVYGLSKWIAYFIQFFSFVRFNDEICLFGLQ